MVHRAVHRRHCPHVRAKKAVWHKGHWEPKLSHHVARLGPAPYQPRAGLPPLPGPEVWVQSLLQGLASRVTVTPSAFCLRLSPLIS